MDPKKAARLGLKQSDFSESMTFGDTSVKKVMRVGRDPSDNRKGTMGTRKAPAAVKRRGANQTKRGRPSTI